MVILIFSVLFSLAFSVATYFLSAYSLMCLGRKSGLKADWMPYVPVARTIYRLQIVRQSWWKFFFVGGSGVAFGSIITLIFALIFGVSVLDLGSSFLSFFGVPTVGASGGLAELVSFIACAYAVAIVIFSFEIEYRTFKVFGFNPYFAIATFVAPVASSVIYYIIAFSNLYEYVGLQGTKPSTYDEKDNRIRRPLETDVQNKTVPFTPDPPTAGLNGTSYILCTAGAYKGGSFPIKSGEELSIGRDSSLCQIVVTSATKVSRRHCGIKYSASDNRYIVTDYSSNGTYLEDGTRLSYMTPTPVSRNTVLLIGDRENQFKLS